MNRIVPILIIVISIASFVFLGSRQIANNSVTADEFVHLPVGLTYLEKRDFSLDRRGNPPNLRQWIAMPIQKYKPVMRFGEHWKNGDFYGVGWEFMVDNAGRYIEFFETARWRVLLSIAALLVFGVVFWAVPAYGWWAGAMVAVLTAFSANVIAHGSLASLDVGLALSMFSAQWIFFQLCRRPGLLMTFLLGIFVGGVMVAKYTGATLVVFQVACLLIVGAGQRMEKGNKDSAFSNLAPLRKIWLYYFDALIIALIFLNLCYLFHGTFSALGDMPLKGKLFGSLAEHAGWLRLPLPSDYILGLDEQNFFTGKYHVFYLMGKLSSAGWWHYFIVTYLVKESIPAILLFVISLLSIFKMRLRAVEIFFLVPAAGTFLFFSFVAKVDLGIRYLLPALPFIYVFTSRLAAVDFGRAKWAARAVIIVLLAWHAVGTVRVSPYLLAYFNEAAGGPEGGYRYVMESNYDWGQNLIALKKYMDEKGIERIRLRNYGLVSPQIYGISASWVPCKPVKGMIAISPNYVYGVDPFMRMGECYKWLRNYDPVEKVGYSLFVYEIE